MVLPSVKALESAKNLLGVPLVGVFRSSASVGVGAVSASASSKLISEPNKSDETNSGEKWKKNGVMVVASSMNKIFLHSKTSCTLIHINTFTHYTLQTLTGQRAENDVISWNPSEGRSAS